MLELRSVFAGYGARAVLSGVSLTLSKGTLLGVVGINGSGKSTLLKAALGLIPPSDGEILLDGRSTRTMRRDALARRVAYLPQGARTPDMTVEQAVLHGRFPHLRYPRRYSDADRTLARAAMAQMGITDLVDRPLSTLSGGMRQTAYLAMALCQDTDYILLDEPTTYLDVAHQLSLMKALRGLADEGKGVLTVMHDLPAAFRFCDRIAVLDHGKLALLDTPAAVAASPALKEIFGVTLKRTPEGNAYFYGED